MTLIEVMIALLLFSSSFLGLVGMQAYAVQASVDSENRTRAAIMANEIAATIVLQNTLTPAVQTVQAWQSRVQDERASGLPEGEGNISAADAEGAVMVTILWRAPSRIAGAPKSKYITQIALP